MSDATLRRACSSLEECAHLRAIGYDLLRDAPKVRYAEWLAERGNDAKAAFVRQYIEAVGAGTEMPDSAPFERAWTSALGVDVFQGIVKQELVELAVEVCALARPVVTIRTRLNEGQVAVGASKFGGFPDLPAGTPWPRCKDGYLQFIGQIDCSDLQLFPGAEALPEQGLLSFFAFVDDGHQPWGVDPEQTQVLHTVTLHALQRQVIPADHDRYGYFTDREQTARDEHIEENWLIRPECRITLGVAWDVPTPDGVVQERLNDAIGLLEDERHREAFWQLRHAIRGPSNRTGAVHHLLGYSIHNRGDDCCPGSDWRTLLCVGSDDNLEWSWCDGEHLSFFIQGAALANRDFSRVMGATM